MKRLLLGFLFLLMLTSTQASHIVGGEFEMIYLGNYRYRFQLIIYFDEVNGDQGNKNQDRTIYTSLYRYSNNELIRDSLIFQFQEISNVNYTNNACAIGDLKTSRMVYVAHVVRNGSTEIFLSPDIYNDPQGYYLIWERCCRNYGITNIYSHDPNGNPNSPTAAGQTFYLHFPPVTKNGAAFVNSTPHIFPPLADYGCPGKPYYVDFAGVDDDGDSLVYSMVTPLQTHNTGAYPPQKPSPFPLVLWKDPFNLEHIMRGSPDLKISREGLLTVTPATIGLYVFAVRCEEYRDGVKLGEVRRDFQMLVVDACAESFPPTISGRAPNQTKFSANINVAFANTVAIEDRCFDIKISDLDAQTLDDANMENIRITAIPIGFKRNIAAEILPAVTTGVVHNDDSISFKICFPNQCPYTESGNFQIGIIAFDDACVQPRADTFYVNVYIEPPPNQRPQFPDDLVVDAVEEGTALHTWSLHASDGDGDVLRYRLVPVGFSLADAGMTFSGPLTGQEAGPIDKTLTWDPKCDVYDFTQQDEFELRFIVEDLDDCLFTHADTAIFKLSITDFSQITPPVINNSITSLADTVKVSMKMYGDPLTFTVTGEDIDSTPILLRGDGIGFSAASYGVVFPRDFGTGPLESQFTWELNCDSIDLEKRDEFAFRLMVVDSLNKCGFFKADTLILMVTVEPPDKENFNPPNVFSPNSDDRNAFFGMYQYDEDTHEFVNILPEDNCYGEFVSIQIYDRWGKQVFESFDRDFKWYGESMPVGVYYYQLRYSNRSYKGIVSLRL